MIQGWKRDRGRDTGLKKGGKGDGREIKGCKRDGGRAGKGMENGGKSVGKGDGKGIWRGMEKGYLGRDKGMENLWKRDAGSQGSAQPNTRGPGGLFPGIRNEEFWE